MNTSSRIEVDYRLSAVDRAGGEVLARRIAFEQTVELPPELITDAHVNHSVVGRVEALRDAAGAVTATLSFSPELASAHLPQLLNLVFGNVSLYPGVRLVGLRLPPEIVAAFPGPQFGLAGVRELLGVYDRPLLATALKPRGLAPERLASLAHAFALGGGDIVKDDQNLVDDFDRFKQRVTLCAEAVARANDRSGYRCLYFPHVSAAQREIRRYLDFVYASGLRGVLLCPMVLGLDNARDLAAEYPLVQMAHPALTGSYILGSEQGVSAGILLGTLFRLAGADISIFPSDVGRFSFRRETCLEIAERLREPLGTMRAAWPCPAGGMQFEDIAGLAQAYGPDSVFLVGGALLGHATSLADGTRAFQAAIQATYPERRTAPREFELDRRSRVTTFAPGFEWTGRPSSEYKSVSEPSYGGTFKGVRRVELVGKFGEPTRSDLRYFEVAPGGFSSHERHVHTHIIIAARGRGTLVLGDRHQALEVNDVAFIGPLEGHQLRCDGPEPFGFYCVVDRHRDRPMAVE